VDVPEHGRFEARVDGAVAGIATYRRSGDVTTFLHTEVDPASEGRGIGSALARGALDAVRAGGGRVRPICPFIRSWIHRHPEYRDLLVEVAGTGG
jgi:predicted GNAT family acetyltransferase